MIAPRPVREIMSVSAWPPALTMATPECFAGAAWQKARSIVRVVCCPAKGQPLQSVSGFSLCADVSIVVGASTAGLSGQSVLWESVCNTEAGGEVSTRDAKG